LNMSIGLYLYIRYLLMTRFWVMLYPVSIKNEADIPNSIMNAFLGVFVSLIGAIYHSTDLIIDRTV